ncbi:MAG: sulfatase-like hydrolase/transferase [Elusimicrobiales bacterium]
MVKDNLKRSAAFLALNFCLSLAIGAFFLLYAGSHPLGLAFAVLALVSNTVMIYAALALAAAPLAPFAAGRAALAALAGLLQLALVTDAAVYKIFHFHLNSMVLNLVLTPGGLESLDQGWATRAVFALAAALAGGAQWYFLRLSAPLARRIGRRRALAAAAALLLCAAADKAVFAWASIYDNVHITRNGQLYPLYQKLSVRSFASKYLGVKLDKELPAGIDPRYSGLDYPKAALRSEPPAKPLNFLVIVVDSMRHDMLAPEIMPETWALGKKASVFRSHYSGGNCTRFGIFSMFYGLYGNYWFHMLGERRGPVLMDELKRQGYDLRLFAAAKLSFPEFNKTCFAEVPREGIYDEPAGADGALRDRDISGKLVEYLKGRDPKKPYFSFIFYDASHGSYDYEPAYEKFTPSKQLNLLLLNRDNYLPLFNRYKNSIHYDDMLIGRILKAVRETGGMEDTVIVVAGDHGEPFFDKGYYGHNQAYSEEEVRVPLVLYVPGRAPGVYSHVTSHLDLPAALLGLAGVRNPPSDYSSGRDLFDAGDRDFVAAFSWDTAAILRGGKTLVMPLEAYRGGVKVYDGAYRELPGASAREFTPQLLSFQKEAKRFSK